MLYQTNNNNQSGFTVIEILIVMVLIGILSVTSVMTYRGLQLKAQDFRRIDDLKNVEIMLESYAFSHNGAYPATTNNPTANWKSIDVRTDDNCFNGTSQTDWVPGFENLPQSTPNTGSLAGVGGGSGCYLYASNGVDYVLSAWNMVAVPQTSQLYRRQGFRTFQTPTSTQFYTCNDNVTGGISQGNYDITKDYYKHSYTITNIETCDEAPPITE